VPVGRQRSRIVPPGVKTARKRFAGAGSARAGRTDSMTSSHGSAMAMLPAPRRTVLRSSRNLGTRSLPGAAVEKAVGLGQRQEKLADVAVRAREGRFERTSRAGVFGLFAAAVGVGEPLAHVARLGV